MLLEALAGDSFKCSKDHQSEVFLNLELPFFFAVIVTNVPIK